MRLILIRHADAGHPDPARYPDDRLRPLTDEGRRDHERVAGALARLGLAPTHFLTSPLVRARETTAITAEAFGWNGAIEPVEALGDQFSVAGLLHHLQRYPTDAMVVCGGHEPHLSRFAASLLHAEGTAKLVLPKSGVIGLECPGKPEPGAGRLLFLFPPQELLRLLE
jgi:phosphohistidine phosphatase